MSPTITTWVEPRSVALCQIEFQREIPAIDPAGWYSFLFGKSAIAELSLWAPLSDGLIEAIIAAAHADSLTVLLIGIDHHPRLLCHPSWIELLVEQAKEGGVLVLVYGVGSGANHMTFKTREQAIEEALFVWESQVRARFSW